MEAPWKNLEGKVVLVTGASAGIGRDLCLDIARAGCRVVAAARRTDRLASLCAEINGSQPSNHIAGEVPTVRSAAVEIDVSAGEAKIERSVKMAWDKFGRIDALVNNAGIRGGVYSPLDWPEEEWNDVINTNLNGLWLVTKHVGRLMRDVKLKGSVINISSIGGLPRGQLPGGGAYTASKAAVLAITKVMAAEMGVHNIRVNAIAPGLFRSEITKGLMDKEWLKTVTEKITPLKVNGPVDPALTSIVRYLIHDSTEYVSGNVFIIDSGATLPGVPIFSSL